MKTVFVLIFSLLLAGSVFSQFSEYDTIASFQYTTTYEKAEYIKDSDSTAHWEFTFRHADGDLFTFKHYSYRFANNLLLNKGMKEGDDTAINIGKRFLVKYCDLNEHIWYDEDAYWWDEDYDYDEEINYYSGISADFAQ
ncbi:MAG: hypothetical protein A2W93_11435 [Bacteroidetes bacterium GWF2_43_63]|nr:MAG: hypothetical protein A2W94_14310 [Bacteroidetes bacterium GWE2_42_42]OFY54883.1 MAG: hypothetical protein A2W93_11435 [Bacteroidetes bacterium GWF2_43_63]HCB63210.1 hypothetical protein [Bacteroidales bacterium]HCY22185.1 hypothetical protein [Bacteroidales bacterium]